MKKLLYSAAIIAALASCSKNEVDATSSFAPDKAINFATLNDRVASRAANDDSDNYQVYAKSSNTSKTDVWFMNETINGSTNAIVSGAVYYWPKDALSFVAYAPATNAAFTTVTPEPTTGNVKIAYANPDAGNIDLTAAQVSNKSLPATAADETVAFKFEHQLAKIIVRVSLEKDETVSGGKMHGWTINNLTDDKYTSSSADEKLTAQLYVNESKADFTFATDGTLSTMAAIAPAVPQTLTAKNHIETADGKGSDINIVPQSSIGCKIMLDGIVIRNDKGAVMNVKQDAEYEIKAGNISTAALSSTDKFEPGMVYVLDMQLSLNSNSGSLFGGTIKFTADCTDWKNAKNNTDWPDDDSTTDEINWDQL